MDTLAENSVYQLRLRILCCVCSAGVPSLQNPGYDRQHRQFNERSNYKRQRNKRLLREGRDRDRQRERLVACQRCEVQRDGVAL